ncbi:hypothetical protein QBZ16_000166 [Prototheca wickerhamii]|uniref:Serine/threonine-protein kinase RIO1 n=1 Tax=Prototheca wickerhamii TaxID=3111 RepID=A0AAD9MMW6_PROWI|nr:hypothetical protein QBZ16_000166 [Prototheca wickerhamii]
MAAHEPSLQELAARYESDSAGSEVDDSKTQEAPLEHATPEQGSEPVLSLTQALFGDPDFRRAAEEAGSDDEDDEEDDDDDDLASALAWADFQDDQLARGNAVTAAGSSAALASALRRPNAHGALQRGNKAATAATRGNAERLGARFHAGADRANRATVEQVLDPRTRMVLFKMLNRGTFREINGVVSTGKEANVYHASAPDGAELAIKIYKTSILVFRDRERYVAGDSRFQRFCKSNPRKMVKLWAEKEMRNLLRLIAAGVRAPRPLQLRLHVLTMEFVGADGLPPARLRAAYAELVLIVRAMFQRARLVHADLSEYNILVHGGELVIIDVSQSVELDHPRAFDFLREDCLHVNDYFRRQGVATLTVKELFDFTVDPAINDGNIDAALDALMARAASRPVGAPAAEAALADAVWAQAFIPKKLEEVTHYERDHDRLQEGGGNAEGIYFQTMAGMKADMTGVRTLPLVLEEQAAAAREEQGSAGGSDDEEDQDDDEDDDHAESGDDTNEWVPDRPNMTREEIRAARKEHQKAVKESNRERRKTKMPKKEKARKIAKSKGRKK